MSLTDTRPGPPLQEALRRASVQEALSREDCYRLINSTGSDIPALMLAASTLRDDGKGHTITYSRKLFFPLTNLCRDTCGYCTFVRQPEDPLVHTMTPEEVLDLARAGQRAGCKEALFSLGDKPELKYTQHRRWLQERGYSTTLEYVRDMCDLVYRETGLLPHINAGLMTVEDIVMLREISVSMGIMLESVSDRLLRPGQAHHRCADKVPALRLATIEAAGRLGAPFTTGILIGIGETPEERVDSLFAIRGLHERYGHIQEVIIQNFRAKPDIPMRDNPDASLLDMLRTIAVARLILGGDMNIQAPPNLMPDACQLYLLAGINDWGGVSPVTRDFINPEAPWPELVKLRETTEAAGFELRERLAIYPEYVARGGSFIPEALKGRIAALVDSVGLVKRET